MLTVMDCGVDDISDEDPLLCDSKISIKIKVPMIPTLRLYYINPLDNCGGYADRFQCANKKCVTKYKACDGVIDCSDGSDESAATCASKQN